MEKEFCTVQTGDKVKCYERGIAYKKIAEEFQEEYPAKIVLALVDGTRLQELNKRLKQDCKIEFVTVKDPIGYETYRRSLCFMLVKAVHDVGGHDKIRNVKIHFSVSNGYYCTSDLSFWIRSFWIRLMQGCMNLQKPKFRSRSVLCIHRMQ